MAKIFNPAEKLKSYNRVQAANFIVRLNKPKLEQYIKSRAGKFGKVTKEVLIRKLLAEYLQNPEHQQFNKALKDSHYYNGGDYTPLVNELRYGI